MTQTRSLHTDERGQGPMLVVAALLVFILVSAGLAAALITGIQTSTSTQVNAAVQEAANSSVRQSAMHGYTVTSALPAEADVEFRIGALTAPAIRTVEINPATRVARVTIVAGIFNGTSFSDPADCGAMPKLCTVATELVTGWVR